MRETDLLGQLNKTQSKLNALYYLVLKRHDLGELSLGHLSILNELQEYKELPMKGLAELTSRDKSTVTPLVNKLINLGFVIKTQDLNDKRISNISITQKGIALKTTINAMSDQIIDRFNLKTTSSERQNLLRLLEKINNSL